MWNRFSGTVAGHVDDPGFWPSCPQKIQENLAHDKRTCRIDLVLGLNLTCEIIKVQIPLQLQYVLLLTSSLPFSFSKDQGSSIVNQGPQAGTFSGQKLLNLILCLMNLIRIGDIKVTNNITSCLIKKSHIGPE